MSTLAIQSTAQASNGTSYMQNVGRAARALLSALITVPHTAPAARATAQARPAARAAARDDLSLYRLYCLASPYDSVMPNLAQELRVIAGRDDDE